MHISRMALALAVFGSLTTVASAAQVKGTKAIPAAKPHHHHHIHGVVVSVERGNAAGHGEIKVKVHHHHHKKLAKTAAAAATTKKQHHHGIVTVHVHSSTKFVKVEKTQGGKSHHHPANFGDVHQGEHVHIALTAKHHVAKHVAIIVHHKNKKSPSTSKRQPPLKSKKQK